MDEEFVETSDPEEIGHIYVWRKNGKGKRVLDTMRAPLGNARKRARVSPLQLLWNSCIHSFWFNLVDSRARRSSLIPPTRRLAAR